MDRFASEGGERHQNRDGWGIMFAEGRDAHLFREASPASNSLLDRFVREHESPSCDVIAHVRRASRGDRKLANTHPFRRVCAGHAHHFAHNGTLNDFERTVEARRLRKECVGDTDSELAFLVLLKRLAGAAADVKEITGRFQIFTDFAQTASSFGPANFLFFDGYALYVYADQRVWESNAGLTPPQPPGLHMMQPNPGEIGNQHRCAAGQLADVPERLVLFASVPLNDDGWVPLSRGTSMVVRRGEIVAQSQ